MKLVQVFEDYEIIVHGSGQYGKYKQDFRVELVPERPELTEKDLEEYVKGLQKRFPERGFKLTRKVIDGVEYHVLTKPSTTKGKRGRKVRVKGRVPIYFRLGDQTFWVPMSFTKRRKKLTNFILRTTLGAMGQSQSKYLGKARKRRKRRVKQP